MRAGIIGAGERAGARARAVKALPGVTSAGLHEPPLDLGALAPEEPESLALDHFLGQTEAVFVAVPTAAHYPVAERATKKGRHVFLEWPPATSLPECEAVVRLVEEAGVEAGVSRPLRFLPALQAVPAEARARLIVLRQDLPADAPPAWPRHLADAVDLCCLLARSHSVQRVDAEAVRNSAAWPVAVAFGLRFHSGTYAQVSFRRAAAPVGHLFAAGPGLALDLALDLSETDEAALLQQESHAFLQALLTQRPPPVSILDGLHTLRLVERLQARLR